MGRIDGGELSFTDRAIEQVAKTVVEILAFPGTWVASWIKDLSIFKSTIFQWLFIFLNSTLWGYLLGRLFIFFKDRKQKDK